MPYTNVIRTMIEYHVESNRRLWQHLLEHVSDEQFVEPVGFSLGSLRHQVVHLAATDRYWLHDIQVKPVTGLEPADYPTRESFDEAFASNQQALLDYVQALTDAELVEAPAGLVETRWEALLHVCNHGTDHRAQILSVLHGLGLPTFEQDLGDYLRRQRRLTRGEVLALLRFRRRQWQEELAAIPRERMTEPTGDGRSVKQLIAELIWYEREMATVLQARAFAASGWRQLPADERNRRIWQQYKELPLPDLLQEHEAAHQALVKAIEQLDDETLNDPGQIRDLPPGSKLWTLLEENTWLRYFLYTEALWTHRSSEQSGPQ
jgi:uncharacterized damage-inducible protein DinB